jgi:hypothetical protein
MRQHLDEFAAAQMEVEKFRNGKKVLDMLLTQYATESGDVIKEVKEVGFNKYKNSFTLYEFIF